MRAASAARQSHVSLSRFSCSRALPRSTLKVFRNGTPAEYTGPRKADGIISYMKK